MADWFANYMAAQTQITKLRCALAWIEGCSRTSLPYPDISPQMLAEINARAKTALDLCNQADQQEEIKTHGDAA